MGSVTDTNITVDDLTASRKMPLYRVLLHNDDVNEVMHVIGVLIKVFHFTQMKSMKIMLEANDTGVALCIVEPLERAELHQEQLQSFSLTATIEPEG